MSDSWSVHAIFGRLITWEWSGFSQLKLLYWPRTSCGLYVLVSFSSKARCKNPVRAMLWMHTTSNDDTSCFLSYHEKMVSTCTDISLLQLYKITRLFSGCFVGLPCKINAELFFSCEKLTNQWWFHPDNQLSQGPVHWKISIRSDDMLVSWQC